MKPQQDPVTALIWDLASEEKYGHDRIIIDAVSPPTPSMTAGEYRFHLFHQNTVVESVTVTCAISELAGIMDSIELALKQ